MGGRVSKRRSLRDPSYGSSSQSWGHRSYPDPQYSMPREEYTPQQHYPPPPQSYGSYAPPHSRRKLERKFSKIEDDFTSLDQVYILPIVILYDGLAALLSNEGNLLSSERVADS